MDEFFGIVVAVILLVLAILGVMFISTGSMDSSVIYNCKERGHWQTGQTRIICHVEETKK